MTAAPLGMVAKLIADEICEFTAVERARYRYPDDYVGDVIDRANSTARAALDAIHDPTESMVLAGAGIEPFRVDFIERDAVKWCWEAMIEAALKGEG